MIRSCSIAGCERRYYAKDFCNLHWQRYRKTGIPGQHNEMRAAKGEPLKWILAHQGYDGEECLIWPFAKRSNGYAKGVFNPLGTMCELVHGPRPDDDREVAHSCGNGHWGCIHPHHLRWATHKDNEGDKELHGTILRGSGIKTSKLTEEDVLLIRRVGIPSEDVAKSFGVSRATISRVISRKIWRHI